MFCFLEQISTRAGHICQSPCFKNLLFVVFIFVCISEEVEGRGFTGGNDDVRLCVCVCVSVCVLVCVLVCE